jgi:two-component system sensor histidine kinase RpfC
MRRLLASSILAIFGFIAALNWSSYWNSQITLGIGLIAGIILISVILFREMENNHRSMDHNYKTDLVNQVSPDSRNTQRLLLITNDIKDRHMLLSYIDSWGINVDTYNSSLRAFAELVNHSESKNQYTTVIVDSLNLDMDPAQFAKYIRLDDALSNINLIHISPGLPTNHEEQLIEAGYTSLIKTPVDKTILFDALHTNNKQATKGKNITKFIKHYASKSSFKQPLDILLAVADPAEQDLFSSTLEHDGHRAYSVSSGSQALDAINTHQFDLVILDFNLPDMEGKEIIRLYYYTYLNEEWVPFIALVDEATPDVLYQCREAEVNAILVRPAEKKELLITVADIASSKTKRAENIDKHWQPPHIHKTQIRDCNDQIINTKTLTQLEELSSSDNFLNQLSTKFNNDMDRLVDDIEQSIRNNCFTDFKDLVYALKDSSCNLGADALHKLSLLALQINQREFQGQANEMLNEIKETLLKTKYALQDHLAKQNSSASEHE